VIEKKKNDKVFGLSLDQVLEREEKKEGIPLVVEHCVQHIRTHGLQQEGIFRVSGIVHEVAALSTEFNNEVKQIDLGKYAIHATTSLLKKFFREMPEPLIPFSLYDKLLALQRSEGDENTKTEKLKLLLKQDLSPNSKSTLIYLLDLLSEISHHQDQNKMTPNNLAVVFGPALMRPQTETIDTAIDDIPVITQLVKTLIETPQLVQ